MCGYEEGSKIRCIGGNNDQRKEAESGIQNLSHGIFGSMNLRSYVITTQGWFNIDDNILTKIVLMAVTDHSPLLDKM